MKSLMSLLSPLFAIITTTAVVLGLNQGGFGQTCPDWKLVSDSPTCALEAVCAMSQKKPDGTPQWRDTVLDLTLCMLLNRAGYLMWNTSTHPSGIPWYFNPPPLFLFRNLTNPPETNSHTPGFGLVT
ncbi:hypothetical protein QBC46DRAFT_388230 [Diplogelasinospora grovesii]|uniref:Uncharacterized protein n=1 Tax=Diplogelasinospora grovesii TaxID=303347 RepID=A0AAN6N5K9_9PEZI|nr:hypothetical protein QBC46DRAFT_388230 [Diplogelasinospora grovesii]